MAWTVSAGNFGLVSARYSRCFFRKSDSSDGDNIESDTDAALKAAQALARTANLFGDGEIKPLGAGYYGSSMITFFSQIQESNFQTVQIQKKEDIWTSFRIFLSKDRAREDAA